jgi:hypothetical protein
MEDGIRGATRLYADTPQTNITGARLAAPEPARPKSPDTYLTTLLKLIPSEIVAGYVAFSALWQTNAQLKGVVIWFWLCFAVCLFLRAYASLPKDQPAAIENVQWVSVAFSCIAFYLWASTVYVPTKDDPNLAVLFFLSKDLAIPPWAAGGIALLFSAVAAIFVPKDEQKPGGKTDPALHAVRGLARQSNRAILDDILGDHWPNDKPIAELGYNDPPSRSALAEQIKTRGVPVDTARIDSDDTTVGDVHNEMNRVKQGWAP